MPQNQRSKKPLNKYLRFSGIAIQMGLIIYLGNLLGKWLDANNSNNDELYAKICTLVAVFIAMYTVIKQVTKLSK
ncbi:AtpZ/AtpI family protein [Tenacibaculum sp. M341]|uniref:AtpZ/AtpI family protein n=1 Tax=Tenacibaculum sp. M341 TaxID=2530339 RepID=UPI0010446496|nr:AtpZ/AtpI family protein [Tenacibaculum sp. M341]TCI92238.1 AtpZ/AtpI family protein [Tenacibaculum sp. M341]